MAKKVIIFDFDGTIADTFQTVLRIGDKLSIELGYGDLRKKFGFEKITKEKIERLRNKRPQDLIKEYKFPIMKIPSIVKKGREELNKQIQFLKPIKGVRDAILKLKKDGYEIGILTSNSEENVKKFLKKNKLDFFGFIYSGSSIFGKHRVIKTLMKKRSLREEEVVYVGDETRDIEAAKKAKVKVISVTWGFNSKKILEKQKPDFLISRPSELIKAVEKI
jgi:HAD superfamily hydrolase (TIGR01662 family)